VNGKSTIVKWKKICLRYRLDMLLPEEGPFPPHPGLRVSYHHRQTQNIELVERSKKLELAERRL
jgi:hypothetical protein